MSTQWGEPATPAQPVTIPAPAEAPPATTPAPAPVVIAPAPVQVPAVGSFARYTSHDSYASPARDRTQLIYVSAHVTSDDGSVTVLGVPLCYVDDCAAFAPGQLSQD